MADKTPSPNNAHDLTVVAVSKVTDGKTVDAAQKTALTTHLEAALDAAIKGKGGNEFAIPQDKVNTLGAKVLGEIETAAGDSREWKPNLAADTKFLQEAILAAAQEKADDAITAVKPTADRLDDQFLNNAIKVMDERLTSAVDIGTKIEEQQKFAAQLTAFKEKFGQGVTNNEGEIDNMKSEATKIAAMAQAAIMARYQLVLDQEAHKSDSTKPNPDADRIKKVTDAEEEVVKAYKKATTDTFKSAEGKEGRDEIFKFLTQTAAHEKFETDPNLRKALQKLGNDNKIGDVGNMFGDSTVAVHITGEAKGGKSGQGSGLGGFFSGENGTFRKVGAAVAGASLVGAIAARRGDNNNEVSPDGTPAPTSKFKKVAKLAFAAGAVVGLAALIAPGQARSVTSRLHRGGHAIG